MKLEGGERLVLKILRDLQGDSTDYVDGARLASATKMVVEDVWDWLETLEGEGFVERTRLTDGFSAYVTAKGKQALRLTEPIPSPKPPRDDAPVTPDAPGGTGTASPQPATAEGIIETVASFLEFFRPRTALMQGLRGLCAIGRLLIPLHVQGDTLANVFSRPH